MKTIKYPSKVTWPELLKRPVFSSADLEPKVAAILRDVKMSGDDAVRRYSLEFDKVELNQFRVSNAEFEEAGNKCPDELKDAIRQAKGNIEAFHKAQVEEMKVIETTGGIQCWRKSVGIEKVGLYIPGGSAPLFSTVLMLGIPAMLAGCREVIICSPCNKAGEMNPAVLYSASLLGIRTVFKIGGVQAIGAMAYGTESISKVYKVFGPGNQYVTCAKQLINKEGIAIDMPAGPSELAVLADVTANPVFVAADLLSQAEHGADSQVILVSTSELFIEKTIAEIGKQLISLPRKDIASGALANSKFILMNSTEDAMALLNEYAAEHLIIACKNELKLAEQIINAGSVFLGNFSPESAGDYASGTNHTLPTNGHAKAYSGVSLDSFVKKISFQQLSREGLSRIGKTVETMAVAEGLDAHKNAVHVRIG